ncbi:MAG TPA: NAD(P)H-binding protein [Candidatus Limnocylindria bacterium]|nr:NAD(P)H-binding protein [Candidatus Limnocylindria bacterium]
MVDAVTGAFSFTGRAIATQLLAEGREVVTLVRRPPPTDADPRIRTAPLAFDDPGSLAAAFTGVDTFYNTYWIRFERGGLTFEEIIGRTRKLLTAATQAGVRRMVHVSVVNAGADAPTEYFVAKARLDDVIRASGMSHAIVRPTLTFGPGDILVNNLTWVLRRFPLFAIPGNGEYRLQPVHVEDVARIAVDAGRRSADVDVDAAGPDILTFNRFVQLLADAVDSRTWLLHTPRAISHLGARALSVLVRDVMLTGDEITELTASLLVSAQPPAGRIGLAAWASAHADELGRRYHSELDRHFR